MIARFFKIGCVLVALAAAAMSSAEDQGLLKSEEEIVEETPSGLRGTRAVHKKGCQELFDSGDHQSGIYTIHPDWSEYSFDVYCKMTGGGGWTVIQRRYDGSVDFARDWLDYQNGFGTLDGEMWIGLQKIYRMTEGEDQELHIDFEDKDGNAYYASYSAFRVDGPLTKYELVSLGDYAGTAGWDALYTQLGNPFSTLDEDHDGWDQYDCAEHHQAGWWFGTSTGEEGSGTGCEECTMSYYTMVGTTDHCVRCTRSNLNGMYDGTAPGTNIFWSGIGEFHQCFLGYTEMSIRPAHSSIVLTRDAGKI